MRLATVVPIATDLLADLSVEDIVHEYLAHSVAWTLYGDLFGEGHADALGIIERGTAEWDYPLHEEDFYD